MTDTPGNDVITISMYPSFLPDTPRIRANSCATLGFSVIINDFAKKFLQLL